MKLIGRGPTTGIQSYLFKIFSINYYIRLKSMNLKPHLQTLSQKAIFLKDKLSFQNEDFLPYLHLKSSQKHFVLLKILWRSAGRKPIYLYLTPNFTNVFDHGNLSGFQEYILTSPRNKYSIATSLGYAYLKKPQDYFHLTCWYYQKDKDRWDTVFLTLWKIY